MKPVLVQVINASTNPVPVTGNVNVGNSAGAAVLVCDVDNAARRALQAGSVLFLPAGASLSRRGTGRQTWPGTRPCLRSWCANTHVLSRCATSIEAEATAV